MKKINLLLLMLLPFLIHSQSFTGFTIGEKIINQDISIQNDSLDTFVKVLNNGYCFRIVTRFIDTNKDDLDYVKQYVDTDKQWDSLYVEPSENYIEDTFNNDNPVNGEILAHVSDKGIKYLIISEGFEDGLLLIEKKEDISKLEFIDRFIRNFHKSSDEGPMYFESYDECFKSPKFIEKKAALKIFNETPIEKIELPYKFNFGMTHQQVTNHFNSILEKNSVLKSNPFTIDKSDSLFGITYFRYNVNTNNAYSFDVSVTYLNGKAIEYSYSHNYDLDKKLREKIQILIDNYTILSTTFGNTIHDARSKEKIKKLKEDYTKRGNLENKM